MKLNIEVIDVNKEDKGKYTQLTATYKNLEDNKIEAKKIMSFAQKETYNSLSKAEKGEQFTIESVKNESSGYWDWIKVEKITGGALSKAVASPKSTYETPEERAVKQVYIVRQSSIANAIALVVANKEKASIGDILVKAEMLTHFVFTGELISAMEQLKSDKIE